MFLLIVLAIGCGDMEITRVVTCSATSINDETWFATSLSAERQRFHDELAADETDWNIYNDLGAAPEALTLDPIAFAGDEAEVCSYADDGSLLQMTAPVSVAVVGEDWVPATTQEGTLLMDASGGVYVMVELFVPLADELRATAETLLESELGTSVEASAVPTEAWLSVGTAGPEAGFFAELTFSPDQTVAYEALDPEPIGVTVPLAKTEH